MNNYEITFIVRPDLDEEETRATVDQLVGRLESAGGEIVASYAWSPPRRRMAYPIKDFGDGFYYTTTYRFDPARLKEFENFLKLNERVLRYLIVQATDQMLRQSQNRMQQLAAAAAAPPPTPAPAPAPPSDTSTTVGAAPAPEEPAPEVSPAEAPATEEPQADTEMDREVEVSPEAEEKVSAPEVTAEPEPVTAGTSVAGTARSEAEEE